MENRARYSLFYGPYRWICTSVGSQKFFEYTEAATNKEASVEWDAGWPCFGLTEIVFLGWSSLWKHLKVFGAANGPAL
jgi:hypothetical protein